MVHDDVQAAALGFLVPLAWVGALLVAIGAGHSQVRDIPALLVVVPAAFVVLVAVPVILAARFRPPVSAALIGAGALVPATSPPNYACLGGGVALQNVEIGLSWSGHTWTAIPWALPWPGPWVVVRGGGCGTDLSLLALAAAWLLVTVGILRR